MGLGEAHSLVSLLLTPTDCPSNASTNWLKTILEQKVQEYSSKCGLNLTPGPDTYFDYVRCCVNALINLKFELSNVSSAPDAKAEADLLSISQQKNVSGIIQMIVALGLLPNLVPGVGAPLDKRSVFLQTVINTVPERSILERYKQLVFSCESLLELSKYKQFHSLMLTRHLGDILACLIQISNAPLVKPKDSDAVPVSEEIKVNEDNFVMTAELYERLSQDQERFGHELATILDKTYQPMLIKYLLILLSSKDAKGKKPPKWFVKYIQTQLSVRLTSENGVANVIRAVLDLGGEGTSFDWTKVSMVADVLGNPPKYDKYSDTEQYFAKICPQLLELMKSDESTVSLIACTSIKTVADRSLILGRRYLLDPLMSPFLRLTESYEEALNVTEQELDDCIKNLTKVFILANDPSMMFVTHLEPIILVLFNLHMSITFGVSHLKEPVKQLLDRYLKYSDKTTSLKIIRALALDEIPDTPQNRVRLMHKDVMFSAGDEGGVKVMKKTDSEQSFYVSDDEKAIAIQDILEELKDATLTSQFFLCLLEDLTVMVEDSKDGMDLELPSAGDGIGLEKQILDLEDHLDGVMHKMRKNLMILRLLSLLSEDKTVEENLMKQSDKMIQFVSVTIKRAAGSVRRGVVHSNLATQSLNMSLSILTVHLTQADLPADDWVKMIEVMDDLETLIDHEDQRISIISGQLHQLIMTQKVVIDEIKKLKDTTAKIQEESARMKSKVNEMNQMKVDAENKLMDERKEQLKLKSLELKKQKEQRKNKVHEFKNKYEEALFNISDPLLPVQGHGLIQLTRLLEEKDSVTLENIDKIRLIFQSNLVDEDSYIYLSSISGLVACASYRTDLVLDCLTKEFSMVEGKTIKIENEESQDNVMAVRTKVGEALVKITKELGDLTPKYKNLLLNTFFAAANDPDPLVRASSLSNMGEVCKNLRFSLGPITGEVLQHLSHCSRDVAADVRGAAVMVLTMILQGLGRDVFNVLQGTIRDIYRDLKMLAATEKEDVVLGQISLALEEIDNIVKQLFTPDNRIEKKIVVLDINAE